MTEDGECTLIQKKQEAKPKIVKVRHTTYAVARAAYADGEGVTPHRGGAPSLPGCLS